ncbi:hypothetical protein [Pseudomonas sp. MPC6]|uniref:hypothetical protein n=1 Tax=unclassified Pseudomonas TaxID=196821 RepID=UPI0015A90773|nr:hypothetical protein [Pseudomonas sp. MPC6]
MQSINASLATPVLASKRASKNGRRLKVRANGRFYETSGLVGQNLKTSLKALLEVGWRLATLLVSETVFLATLILIAVKWLG